MGLLGTTQLAALEPSWTSDQRTLRRRRRVRCAPRFPSAGSASGRRSLARVEQVRERRHRAVGLAGRGARPRARSGSPSCAGASSTSSERWSLKMRTPNARSGSRPCRASRRSSSAGRCATARTPSRLVYCRRPTSLIASSQSPPIPGRASRARGRCARQQRDDAAVAIGAAGERPEQLAGLGEVHQDAVAEHEPEAPARELGRALARPLEQLDARAHGRRLGLERGAEDVRAARSRDRSRRSQWPRRASANAWVPWPQPTSRILNGPTPRSAIVSSSWRATSSWRTMLRTPVRPAVASVRSQARTCSPPDSAPLPTLRGPASTIHHQLALGAAHARRERLHVVAGADRHLDLRDDRAAVAYCSVIEVHGRAADRGTPPPAPRRGHGRRTCPGRRRREAAPDGCCTRARIGGERLADRVSSCVASEQQVAGARLAQRREHRRVGVLVRAGADVARRHSCGACSLERSRAAVGFEISRTALPAIRPARSASITACVVVPAPEARIARAGSRLEHRAPARRWRYFPKRGGEFRVVEDADDRDRADVRGCESLWRSLRLAPQGCDACLRACAHAGTDVLCCGFSSW